MKKVIVLITLLIAGVVHGQSQNSIDHRLKINYGDRISQIYEKQKIYYDFLVWELGNGYKVVDASKPELKDVKALSVEKITNSKGQKFESSMLNAPEEFNFINFNFERNKREAVYYDLGNGKLIMFTSLTEVLEQFKKIKK